MQKMVVVVVVCVYVCVCWKDIPNKFKEDHEVFSWQGFMFSETPSMINAVINFSKDVLKYAGKKFLFF